MAKDKKETKDALPDFDPVDVACDDDLEPIIPEHEPTYGEQVISKLDEIISDIGGGGGAKGAKVLSVWGDGGTGGFFINDMAEEPLTYDEMVSIWEAYDGNVIGAFSNTGHQGYLPIGKVEHEGEGELFAFVLLGIQNISTSSGLELFEINVFLYSDDEYDIVYHLYNMPATINPDD